MGAIWKQYGSNMKARWKQYESNIVGVKARGKQYGCKSNTKQYGSNMEAIWKQYESNMEAI